MADRQCRRLDGLLTDDFVDHDPLPGFSVDKEGAKQVLAAFSGEMKDLDMSVSRIIVDGDNAAAFWTAEWTQVGDFMGQIPADGRRLRMRGHDYFGLRDGLIAELWHAADMFGVMAQLGVVPQSV